MFRRRPDLSWPLIALLAGLFFLSLRMPRQWERIARDSRLSLRHAAPAEVPAAPIGAVASDSVDEAEYRAIEPAQSVAANVTTTVASEATSPVVGAVPAAAATTQSPDVPPASAPRDKDVEISIEADHLAPQQQSEPKIAVQTIPEPSDEVRVMRDASPLPISQSLLKTTATQTQTDSSESPNVTGPSFATTAAPEPLTAAAQQVPATESVQTVPRPIAPEPRAITAYPIPQPTDEPKISQPSLAADKQGPAPVPQSSTAAQSHKSADIAVEDSGLRPMKAIGRAWEEPASLLVRLQRLQMNEPSRTWAAETINDIQKLGPAIAVGAPETDEILGRLDEQVRKAATVASTTDDDTIALEIGSTAHALARRLVIWKQIGQMGGMMLADAPAPTVDSRSFNKALSDIEQLTANSPEGHAWRKYLLVDSLRDWATRRRNNEERMPRDLAQKWLARVNRMSMTSGQRQFLTTGPMAALNREMLRNTAEPVESRLLLKHLENYEKSGLPSDAHLLARDCQNLSVSTGAAQHELGDRVEMYFRNANIRVAVTAELLNRMIPKREPEYAPVQDRIQGAEVRGQSLTANEVSVRMIPDPEHVRMALIVNGEVAAVTRSTSGPATFYTDSESSYFARKPVEVTLRGITMLPTEVSVDNSSTVRGVRTDFDRMPLFDRIARNMALTQYDERRPAADAEVRRKIADKAKERVDREATQQVSAAAKRLHDELLGPMDSLLLDPILLDAKTTEKRFEMRIRLAGPDQLGGHTPRPAAPSDSLASVQIHESLLNNMLERLELDGETFSLAGLNQRLAERMHRFTPRPIDPDQEDVKITFAAKDAVHVRCHDGHMELTLAIARLSKGIHKFKDFQVRATYKPMIEGRSVDLVRDGIVQLICPRMNAFAQTPLRSVFLKIFSDKRPFHMMPEAFVKNPKLNGVVVTQFVIDDGWIAAALGPQRRVAVDGAAVR
jgi:hypothetical protein